MHASIHGMDMQCTEFFSPHCHALQLFGVMFLDAVRTYLMPFLTQHIEITELPWSKQSVFKPSVSGWLQWRNKKEDRQDQACVLANRWETLKKAVCYASSPTAHDLIAELQHEPCEEIGQLAGFLSCRVGANQTQMKPYLNNHVFTGSSSGDKQQLEINTRPPCQEDWNHKRPKSIDELLIRCCYWQYFKCLMIKININCCDIYFKGFIQINICLNLSSDQCRLWG